MAVRVPLLFAALAAAALSACGAQAPPEASTGPVVVVTTTILGDVVDQVVGDGGRVEVLMAPGQDPHGFAPSAKQAERLREADLVVANGLGLEEGARDMIEAAAADGVPVLRVAEELDPAGDPGADHDAGQDDTHGDHDHDAGDPHIWFDPLRMAEAAREVGHALADITPGDWGTRAEATAASMEALHEDVAELLAPIPERCRRLVTNHDNLGHLAARYDLEVVGTVLPGTSTAVDPSARDFAALAELVRATQAPAIFVETTQGARLAQALATEVGREIAVVELYTDALGEPGSGAETYRGLMTTDARRIADALADC